MEIAAKKVIMMEMVDMTSRLSEAGWPLCETDSFTSFVFNSQALGSPLTFDAHQRRKIASELLDVLESAQTDLDEPYSGWLEEPMDLDVFGQSLEQSSRIPLDEVQAPFQFFEPSSPLASGPSTPLAQPTSPQNFHVAQDDQFAIKSVVVPDNEELLESLESLLHQFSLESLLHQFNSNDSSVVSSVSSPEQLQDDDVASALLDSLITEHVDDRQLIDELAEFSRVLLETTEQGLPDDRQSIESTPETMPTFCIDSETNSTCSTSPDDSFDSISPAPKRRGRKPQAVEPSPRKPRSRTAKPEDKRLRKKEQNKTAATRYRMKKKAELDLLLDEEAQLEERHRHLQAQYDDLASEVRYLKKLFREVITGRPVKRK